MRLLLCLMLVTPLVLIAPSAAVAETASVPQGAPDRGPAATNEEAWEGILETGPGTTLRLVLHVESNASGMKASLDSPDQGIAGLTVNSIQLGEGRLSFESRSIAARFAGTLDASRTKAVGEFTQRDKTYELTLAKYNDRPYLVLNAGAHTSDVRKVRFSPNGKQLVTVSSDKTIRVWDVASGASLRVFRPPIGPGREGEINAIVISPDGRTLVAAGISKGTVGGLPIYVISLEQNRITQVLVGHRAGVHDVDFSPDGRKVVSVAADREGRIWDVASSQCELVLKGHESGIAAVAYSPDGRHVATASADKTCRIWDANTGQCTAVLKGSEQQLSSITWRPDGAAVAAGGMDKNIRQWNLDGSTLANFERLGNSVTSVRFTSDGKRIMFTRGSQGSFVCSVLDSSTGRELTHFDGHADSVQNGTLSPDGTLAATADASGVVCLWRAANGALVRRLPEAGRSIYAVGWGPEGDMLMWGNAKNYKSDNDRGPLEYTFWSSDLEMTRSVAPGSRRALSALGSFSVSREGPSALAVKNNDAALSSIRINPLEPIRCYTFLAGPALALGTQYSLLIADVSSGKILRKLRTPLATHWALAPSPDGRFLLSGSSEKVLHVWNLDRVEPVLSLFAAGDDWVAWTPEGYYAASPGGEQLMGWQTNNGSRALASFYPASQFRKTLYRPDVIKVLLSEGTLDKALATADSASGRRNRRTEVARILPPKVAITSPHSSNDPLDGRTIAVESIAKSVGSNPITAVRLLLDGRPVAGAQKSFPAPIAGEARLKWTVEIPPGTHQLIAQADSGGSKGLSDPVDVVGRSNTAAGDPRVSRTLYVLAIGINDYPDKRLKLDSAAPDAKSLEEAFRAKSRRLFKDVKSKLIIDRQATRANILEGLRWLTTNAKANDVVVVFYAGHGDCKIEGQFYLVPVDANLRNLSGTGVSGEALKRSLAELPSATMLVLDACYAGSFDAKNKKKRKTRALPDSSDALVRDLAYDAGLVVMCGASKEEEAIEEKGKGFFTQAFVEGLSGKGDLDKDGLVEVDELQVYVKRRVRDLSAGDQEPTISQPSTVRSFALSKP
jgi:WD40 repeat protein